jgi:hypothetical protein
MPQSNIAPADATGCPNANANAMHDMVLKDHTPGIQLIEPFPFRQVHTTTV